MIIVYAGSSCRTCEKVKEYLAGAGVPFEARNVDEDIEAYDALLERGFRSVPIAVIGDRVVKGYDVDALSAAVAAWRAAAQAPGRSSADRPPGHTPSA